MVVAKDNVCSRKPRPQIRRSKSVGAVTRRTHGPTDSRQHKKKPYSNSSDARHRRNSSCTLASPPGIHCKDIYRHQGTFDNTFQNYHLTQSDCMTVNNISTDLERQLSLDKHYANGSCLSVETPDYSRTSFLSSPANIPRNALCSTTGQLTDNRFPKLDGIGGQGPGELSPVSSQLANNNVNNVSLPETIHKLQANVSSAGLMQMTNMNPEFLYCEKTDKDPLYKMDDAPPTMIHQYSHRPGARTTRRPLASRNLEDNQLNGQGAHNVGNATDSQRVRQSEAYPQKHYMRAQMSRGEANMSQDFNNDENVANETELRCFAPTEEDRYDCDADQDVHSSRFGDQCLDSAQQNVNKKKIVPTDNEDAATNVLRCEGDTCEKSSSSLRRQDTLLLHQDNNIDDENDDADDDNSDNDLHYFCESLKSFLCQEIPNDSDILQNIEGYHCAETTDHQSDQTRVSYKNLLNCSPRYQCLLCGFDLEMVPLQQHDLAWEHEWFPFLTLADITSQTNLYCPQCCCLRSIYSPE